MYCSYNFKANEKRSLEQFLGGGMSVSGCVQSHSSVLLRHVCQPLITGVQKVLYPLFVIHHCSQMHWTEKLLYDFPSSENFPPDCSGCQQTRTAGELQECPVVTTGSVLEVLLSQKYYLYSRRSKFVVQSWIELQSESFVFKKQVFPQAYKTNYLPFKQSGLSLP